MSSLLFAAEDVSRETSPAGEERGETDVFAGYTMSNYHFITAILKSQSSVSDLVSNLFKSGNNKAFTSNFVFETEMMRFRKNVI